MVKSNLLKTGQSNVDYLKLGGANIACAGGPTPCLNQSFESRKGVNISYFGW